MNDAINTDQAKFAIKHGDRTTDRMVEDLLEAIADLLNASQITCGGKRLSLKTLGNVGKDSEGTTRLLFDVKNPDETFDHIEFKIIKTGWGRALSTPQIDQTPSR